MTKKEVGFKYPDLTHYGHTIFISAGDDTLATSNGIQLRIVVDTKDTDDNEALMHLSLAIAMGMLGDRRLAEIIQRGVMVYNLKKAK